jgi:8-oxo-dGTP diphosphatase
VTDPKQQNSLADYERPSVTVDLVVFRFEARALEILLIQRGLEPFLGKWALPGGFVGIDEALEEAAERELAEETAITSASLEQLRAFGKPDRDPRGRVISVAYLALLPPGAMDAVAGDDAASVRWCSTTSLPSLAFDHAEIIDIALTHLKDSIQYSDAAFRLLAEEFTLSELQAVYETVLNEQLDKRNFRRKVLQANIVEPTANLRSGEGRPARLYRLQSNGEPDLRPRRLFP